MNDSTKPNPGSAEARAKGCRCPVVDNNYGQGIWRGDERTWWQVEDCPLHGLNQQPEPEAPTNGR